MPAKQDDSIKNPEMYDALRGDGASKEKAARISNAAAQPGRSKSSVAAKGGRSGSYEDWTVRHLRERAREIGVAGRSTMTKDELISALRDS